MFCICRGGLESYQFPKWFYGETGSTHSRGVATGFGKTMMFVEVGRLDDPEGRYLFIKGKLFNMMCTIANIYAPNRDPDNFLKKVLKKLEAFKEGKLMIAGDLNWSIDPRIESSGGTPRFTAHRYEAFKNSL